MGPEGTGKDHLDLTVGTPEAIGGDEDSLQSELTIRQLAYPSDQLMLHSGGADAAQCQTETSQGKASRIHEGSACSSDWSGSQTCTCLTQGQPGLQLY